MIEIFFSPTANCQRVLLAAALMDLPYRVHPVDRAAGEQKSADFLAINPAAAVPAIIDHGVSPPLVLAQSGAILVYMAEKSGRFLPEAGPPRYETMHWLMQVMTDVNAAASLGFMARQGIVPGLDDAGRDFFRERLARFLATCEARLISRAYLADKLSIADIALYPIIVNHFKAVDIGTAYPALSQWARRIEATGPVAALLPLPG
ncbi:MULTISPECIES: glutathione S-transferase family protein [unclassified Chelatococcus]|uniref:glutathione S-transferase family protein n=1 Tax=unclassified Chelatococcus TaxID=2638111 RepID=UPI001BD1BCD1|nr:MULTISPECIES: glutathione S-transferase family protein [unclassified Chelatococcus]CAH1648909.1 Glutathione S-transferase [Hyphomicrobiales bacterium]MBS7741843.1 glutathione S-transferase family protein [Chelatococcus sp. HY11]MBX3541359.1 glutathione S-transferase family protein [Chelatococcus sp.]MCO5074747.1 glutathione S-transferase family protein [Chelatococcus sp.]CAH1691533.1 Glutathione S-transferase [Hyphomicrobiales bacterium]